MDIRSPPIENEVPYATAKDVATMSYQRIYAILSECEDKNTLIEALHGFALKLGYEFFIGIFQYSTNTFLLSRYPRAWYDRYKAQQYMLIDPVIKHAFQSYEAFHWDEVTVTESGRIVMDEALAYGLRDGFSIPARGPDNTQLLLSMAGTCTQNLFGPDRFEMVSRGQHIGQAALAAGLRVLRIKSNKFNPPGEYLTDRQLKTLELVGRGLSVKEISQVMQVSTTRINQLLESLKGKYLVNSREEMLVSATKRGHIGNVSFPSAFLFTEGMSVSEDVDQLRPGRDPRPGDEDAGEG